jgi:inosose dehydratase
MSQLHRRAFLKSIPTGAATLMSTGLALASGHKAKLGIGLGWSLYNNRTLRTPDAMRLASKVGYDDVEPAIYPGWQDDPKVLTRSARREMAHLFGELGLGLSGLDEDLRLLVGPEAHRENLERIKRASQLWRDIYPFNVRTPGRRHRRPVLVLTLGGKTAEWEQAKEAMAERLREWAEVGRSHEILLAIKPHVGSALHSPEGALWLMQQAASPWVRVTYDYSHFRAMNFDMVDSIRLLGSHAVFAHAKDATVTGEGKTQFLMPGDGDTDYVTYLKELQAQGYRGSIVLEVSGQIHRKPGYDPLAAARHCYRKMSRAFEKAGVPRV